MCFMPVPAARTTASQRWVETGPDRTGSPEGAEPWVNEDLPRFARRCGQKSLIGLRPERDPCRGSGASTLRFVAEHLGLALRAPLDRSGRQKSVALKTPHGGEMMGFVVSQSQFRPSRSDDRTRFVPRRLKA